ncbi:cache domain-containing protein [Fusibacter sp. JL216-2]|uniref:sensor histidine kinase n=1 Tax=Fusibacter sp. JL216-2 TaxID=3071453 RepID=UPI003D3310D0
MKSYQSKVMILIIIFIFCSMALMFHFVNRSVMEEMREDSFKRNRNYTQMIKRTVDLHTEAVVEHLSMLSKLDALRRFELDKMDEIMKSAVDEINLVSQMYVMDSKGYQIYKTSFIETIGDRSDRTYFNKAIEGEVYISSAIISRSTGRPISVVAIPIYNGNKIIGVLGASLDLSYLSDVIADVEISENGYGLILDREGKIIAHPEIDTFTDLMDLNELTDIFFDKDKQSGNYIFEPEQGGEERLISYNVTDRGEWTVIVQIPTIEAFKAITERKNKFLAFTVIIFVFSVWFAIPVSKRISKPVEEIRDVLNGIAQNDFSVKFEKDRNDEFGLIQKDIVFMAEELSITQEELEQRVMERTDELNASNESLKKTLAELNRIQNQLVIAERFKAVHDLGIRMSHEVNTAIGNSMIATSYLHRESEKTFQRFSQHSLTQGLLKEYIKSVIHSADAVQNQLKQIDTVMKSLKSTNLYRDIESIGPINLTEEVEKAIVKSNYNYVSTYIKIDTDVQENADMQFYETFIEQIIIELINNSIKYGFSDNVHGQIQIQMHCDVEKVYLIYRDDGMGISEEIASNIFEPFAKSDMANEGYGMGLSGIYNMVVNIAGGHIECESRLGQGVEFRIEMPLLN